MAIITLPFSLNADEPLMDPARRERFLRMIPPFADVDALTFYVDPNTIFFTDREVEKVYQDYLQPNGNPTPQDAGRVSSIYRNVAGTLDEFGNANREFPWLAMGGTDGGNVTTLRGLRFPTINGKQWTIRYWNVRPYRWVYPNGSRLSELGFLKDPKTQRWYAFENRFRDREPDDWGIDVHAPFPTLKKLVEELRKRNYQDLADECINAPIKEVVVESPHPNEKLRLVAHLQKIPPFPRGLVIELLTKVSWESKVGEVWSEHADGPTTDAEFHFIPKNSKIPHLGRDRDSCRNCHRDVAMHARDFDAGREWYGGVRGGDGIFLTPLVPPDDIHPIFKANKWMLPHRPTETPEGIYSMSWYSKRELKRWGTATANQQPVQQPQRRSVSPFPDRRRGLFRRR